MVKYRSKTAFFNIIGILMLGLLLLFFEFGEYVGTLLAK